MSPGVPPRSLLALIAALAVRWSNSEHTTCQIWSSAGKVVQRGSSLCMFCTFESMCQKAVYVEGVRHDHTSLNSTTVYIKVVNITGHLTCLCQCADRPTAGEECGIDVLAGYLPDRPGTVTCIQHETDHLGIVVCSWNSGKETNLLTTSRLWVMSASGNYTGGSVNRTGFSVGSTMARVKLNLKPSIQTMSVKVYVCNDLGSAESDAYKFTLRDIVKPSPPALILVECSSRSCNITWDRPLETHLEIQYRFQPDSDWQTSSSRLPSVHSLQPFRWYSFRARVKLSHGLWSDWSAPLSNMTQEEAPDKELDVWVSRVTSHPNTLMVYWKPLSGSEARGRLLGYRVIINNSHAGNCTTHTVGAQATCLSVQSCDTCLVTVSAFNSIGSSPPARLPTHVHTAQPPQDLQVFASKCNVSLYWRKADPTLLSTGYLVEWYPQGQQLEKLQWMQLSTAESHALITDMESYECYDGAVYVFYKSSVGKASFEGVNTLVTVPQGAPSVTPHLWGDTVRLTWTQVPRVKRGGCVRNYTIYIKNNKDSKDKRIYQFPASVHQCTTDRLPPATYIVWMTAWTAEGEGPGSEKVEIVIQPESMAWLFITIPMGIIAWGALLGLGLLMRSQRPKMIHCLLPDIPDPHNSVWAKAFTENKGTMDPRDSSSEEEEEEEHIVKFFEYPNVNGEELRHHHEGITHVSSLHRPERDSGTAHQTLYIKSVSHDSDSSHYTQGSLDTGTTAAGYLSSPAEESGAEESGAEGAERDEEEECTDFSPCNIFDEPLVFAGMLTLDTVKIDCRNLWENGL